MEKSLDAYLAELTLERVVDGGLLGLRLFFGGGRGRVVVTICVVGCSRERDLLID